MTTWEYGQVTTTSRGGQTVNHWSGPDGGVYFELGPITDLLSQFGAEGWECYAVTGPYGSDRYPMHHLKRQTDGSTVRERIEPLR